MWGRRTALGVAILIAATGIALSIYTYLNAPRWEISEWNSNTTTAAFPKGIRFSVSFMPSTLAGNTVTLTPQLYGGVSINGTFLKTLSRDGRILWSRARFVKPELFPPEQDVRRSAQNTENVLRLSGSKEKDLNCKYRSSKVQTELRHRRYNWQVTHLRLCEFSDGRLEQIAFNERGQFLGRESVGSAFSWQRLQVPLYPEGPKRSALQPVPMPVSSDPFFLTTPNVEASDDGGFRFVTPEQLLELTPEDDKFDLAQAYYYASNSLRWANQQLRIQIEPVKLRTHVGYPEKTNAFFYFDKEIRLGTGDGKTFERIALDPSIVTHETMHAVIDSLTGLPYQGEGGALNEGLADTLTALFLNNPRMGETAYRKGPYQRSLEEFVHFENQNGGPYHDGLILSGMIWQMHTDVGAEVAQDILVTLLSKLTPDSNAKTAKQIVKTWFSNCLEGERCHRIAAILNQRGWL